MKKLLAAEFTTPNHRGEGFIARDCTGKPIVPLTPVTEKGVYGFWVERESARIVTAVVSPVKLSPSSLDAPYRAFIFDHSRGGRNTMGRWVGFAPKEEA